MISANQKGATSGGVPFWLAVLTRLAMAVGGGYYATAGLVAALAASLPFVGLARADAMMLASMSGFVIYLVLLIWSFAERRLALISAGLMFFAVGGLGVSYLIKLAGA